ncbi:DNA translocase FtsK [Helicobacter cetorum]|uniref:DNA translocase FtsK n=1 Tax=Helicobacter cetorum TaxID=138563 RepID=UPI000CF1ADC9|nr:DNA translocase FtsK [Helicobacter cetorum]
MKSKKLYLALILGAILVFLTLSSWLGNSGLVGRFGVWFATLNKEYFGYLALFNLPYLIYFLVFLYKSAPPISAIEKTLEKTLGHLLGVLALLLLQSNLFDKGEIGNSVCLFLRPFIGNFGIDILIFLMALISYLILFKLPQKSVFTPYILKMQSFLKQVYEQCLQAFIPKRDSHLPHSLDELELPPIENTKPQITKEDLQESNEPKEPLNNDLLIAIPTPYNSTLNNLESPKGSVQISSNVPTDFVIYPNRNKLIESDYNQAESQAKQVTPPQVSPKAQTNPTTHTQKEITTEVKKEKAPIKKEETSPKEDTTSLETYPEKEKHQKTHNNETTSDTLISEESPTNSQEKELEQTNPIEESKSEEIEMQEIEMQERETEIAPNIINKQEPTTESTNNPKKHVLIKELSENKEMLDALDYNEKIEKPKDYELPSITLLNKIPTQSISLDENEIDQKIQDLLSKLRTFKIDGDIVRTYSGPIVTTFEFRPAPNVKVSRISGLSDDLAMTLCAESIRIQAPIKGKDVVGIEIPNSQSQIIYLREILESELFQKSSSPLTLALGKDIVGNPFITDLKKLPHLLIAGTTGSGKSVGVNAMILSLLYKNPPEQLKLVMIDPKMVEFSIYADIPHLLTPIITDPKKAIGALQSVAKEMERRYSLMSEYKVKTIDSYNEQAKNNGVEPFPYLVVVIDELADLMMTGGKEAEIPIARIAQMGRASGLHLIVATQRPSVDVVTGLIKTNLPSRVSFRVGAKIDSKVILDTDGAQSLLGRGDMLFTPPGSVGLVRLHAPFASEDEIQKIVDFIKAQREVEYDKNFLLEESRMPLSASSNQNGDIMERAKAVILEEKNTSTSFLQRKLKIGYNQAATITDELEAQGFLSPRNAKGNREILG